MQGNRNGFIDATMNEKNNGNRKSVTIDAKWHRRFKLLAARFGVKMEVLMDEAAAAYLAKKPIFESK